MFSNLRRAYGTSDGGTLLQKLSLEQGDFYLYGLNPTLFHNSAQLYITPLVITYSTLRVL